MSSESDQSIRSLHERYLQQATWTSENRTRLLGLAGLARARRVLEVGSGTGVITAELSSTPGPLRVYGLDIDPALTKFADEVDQTSEYLAGDGKSLPFPSGCFDIVLCHFLLLWTSAPDEILEEMVRVTVPGGSVIAMAEPDYGGRIDFPRMLEAIGSMQVEALAKIGADVLMGRKLRSLFENAGLSKVVAGVLGGEWREELPAERFKNEWDTIERDLEGMISTEELSRYRTFDREASSHGERILYVPTFYAYGRVRFK